MKRWVKRAVGSALALLVLLSSALYFYTKDYYHAQEQVVSVFSMADHIEVYDDYTVLAADSCLLYTSTPSHPESWSLMSACG